METIRRSPVRTTTPSPRGRAPGTRGRAPWFIAAAVVVVLIALGLLARAWSSVSLASDPSALGRVHTGPLAGTLQQASVFGPDGRAIPVSVHGGRLTPVPGVVAPGERVSVQVVVRRPGALSWLLGSRRRDRLVLAAPAAHVTDQRITLTGGSTLHVKFDQPVSAVAYGPARHGSRHELAQPAAAVTVGAPTAAGTIEVASAARPWERVGAPQPVTWFPASRLPVAVASPAPGARIAPTTPLRLTFSKKVSDALGSAHPTISPATPGRWRRSDDYTLTFTPSGGGAPLGAHLRVALPRAVAVLGPGGALRAARTIDFSIRPGSPLRLQQLLAGLGYLPLSWHSAGATPPHNLRAQVDAAVAPPRGRFVWRYPNTPPELRALWHAGRSNNIVQGAVMAFEDRHGLTADGFAGPEVWHRLLADAIANKQRTGGYSYVYVHRDLPQSLNLWHNGHVIVSSPGNTGVPAAPTQLGTFAVFEHIPVGTMSGTNPGGGSYNDPGIQFISYFNGGDAIHAFTRASFGTPQSLGCVELPLAAAAKVYPYTPIGTLVTVEH